MSAESAQKRTLPLRQKALAEAYVGAARRNLADAAAAVGLTYDYARKLMSETCGERFRVYLGELEAAATRAALATAEDVHTELTSLARSDLGDCFDYDERGEPVPRSLRDIPAPTRRSIKRFSRRTLTAKRDGEEIVVGYDLDIVFHDKVSALRQLGQATGLLKGEDAKARGAPKFVVLFSERKSKR